MTSIPYLILLADDDLSDQEIFKNALKSAKFKSKVNILNNGVELINYLNSKNNLPDVIFLDINMPLKNGLECLQEIRSEERFKELIIVMFSNTTSQQKIVESFENGANVYLSKSHSKEKLHKAIQKIIMYTHLYKTPPFHIDNFIMKLD
jgi:CheY-like chemotaxis protein